MMSDSLKRLGNGMHLFISAGPPTEAQGCPFEAMTAIAPYVRVGSDSKCLLPLASRGETDRKRWRPRAQ